MSFVDRCYYRTTTFDPESSLPLYVLDSTFVPATILNNTPPSSPSDSFDSQPKLQKFVDRIISKLPYENHALVVFTNGFSSPSQQDQSSSTTDQSTNLKLPLNIIKILKNLPQDSKKYLKKIYIVHSTWLLKSIVELFNKFYSFNSSSHPIILNCDNLSSLAHYIDITKIPISLHTYLIDKIQYKNNKIILNRHLTPIYGCPLTIYSLHNSSSLDNSSLPLTQFQRIFNNLIAYLSNKDLDVVLSLNDWKTIIRCSALSNETKISIDILSDCLKRDQLLVLSDYSFLEHYMIIVKFMLKLSNSSNPLIPLEILISHNQSSKSDLDFDNLKQVNYFLNEVLTFRHPLIDLNKDTSTFTNDSHQEESEQNEIDSYDNSYILIKLFKLFRFLLNKLEREASILEPNAKNPKKSVDRQSLRLILSFTKILYTDNSDSTSVPTQQELDYDDIGFDNLFKLIRSVMKYFDKLTILGTKYTLDDFNNHISFDDFLAFENFKNKQLGVEDVLESKIVSSRQKCQSPKQQKHKPVPPEPRSPIKPKISNELNNAPPLPPMPRKNPLLHLEKTESSNSVPSSRSVSSSSMESTVSSTSSTSIAETSAGTPIPVTRSEMDILTNSLESLGLDESKDTKTVTIDYDKDNLYQTPRRDKTDNTGSSDTETLNDTVGELLTPTRQLHTMPSVSSISDTLLTPSPRKQQPQMNRTPLLKPAFLETASVNNNLRKYTVKDLEVQQQAAKLKQVAILKEQHAKEVEMGVRRGERKVSRLARLYEEKYMNLD